MFSSHLLCLESCCFFLIPSSSRVEYSLECCAHVKSFSMNSSNNNNEKTDNKQSIFLGWIHAQHNSSTLWASRLKFNWIAYIFFGSVCIFCLAPVKVDFPIIVHISLRVSVEICGMNKIGSNWNKIKRNGEQVRGWCFACNRRITLPILWDTWWQNQKLSN